ncbi:MAG: YhgE/Pip family protein, partial [Mycoplasmataceae bacterium]|nr:YhgE/Pip family protein [Mycoplasmataceae bacterium]
FKHVDRLKIAVVSRDQGDKTSNLLIKNLHGKGTLSVGNQIYNIEDKTNELKDHPREAVESGEYAAVIVIPKGYGGGQRIISGFIYSLIKDEAAGLSATTEFNKWLNLPSTKNDFIKHQNLKKLIDNLNINSKDITLKYFIAHSSMDELLKASHKDIKDISVTGKENYEAVTFINSYKHSYLAGEMTNFLSQSNSLVIKVMFPDLLSAIKDLSNKPAIKLLISKLTGIVIGNDPASQWRNLVQTLKDKIITKSAPNIKTYGFGLAPYFISIALWAGALVMTFVIKNERHIKTEGTMKHYFGKTLLWVISGWIQTLILITVAWLQGVDLGFENQWELYLMALLTSTIFTMTVQAASYTMRYGDMGEFLVVILLVLQLTSSSGTFPVEMQNIIFKIIHPIVPFTYSIDAIREIFWNPDWLVIVEDSLVLMLFPIIFIPITLTINYLFDKKTVKVINGIKTYKSFEKHMGDF